MGGLHSQWIPPKVEEAPEGFFLLLQRSLEPGDDLFKAVVRYEYLNSLREIQQQFFPPTVDEKIRLENMHALCPAIGDNRQHVKPSNRAQLDKAEEWMDPLVKKFTLLELPTEDQIIELIEEVYPAFRKEFDLQNLKTPLAKGRRYIKEIVCLALAIVFEKKHKDENISYDAIRKRYERVNTNYW